MEKKEYPAPLEARLEALAARIGELKRKLATAKGRERVEETGEIEELEIRHKNLLDRVQKAKIEGQGFWEDARAELEGMADDLVETVEDFILWADTDYASGKKPTKRRKP